MKILAEIFRINLAMLPIGGVFTMDPQQATLAAKLLKVDTVIPMHYKTFPILEKDTLSYVEIMKKEAPNIKVIVLNLGEEYIVQSDTICSVLMATSFSMYETL